MAVKADYHQLDDTELLDIFSRVDPRWAPRDYQQIKEMLVERGFVIHETGLGPGWATPSSEKTIQLVGSPKPIQVPVAFSLTHGLFSRLEAARNKLGLVGEGVLELDGIYLTIFGQRAGVFGALFARARSPAIRWMAHRIVRVAEEDDAIGLVHKSSDGREETITLWIADDALRSKILGALPGIHTAEFDKQVKALVEIEALLGSRSAYATGIIILLNTLIFALMIGFGRNSAPAPIAWGSNFGPFTSGGAWWRLITSMFIHFGVFHLLFNMWGLTVFGPIAERLFGTGLFLLIYGVSGVIGGLASISFRPDINSAGASAAICGILGGLLAFAIRSFRDRHIDPLQPLSVQLAIFTGYVLLAGLMSNGIDEMAHLGGLVAGFLLGFAAMPGSLAEQVRTSRVVVQRYAQVSAVTLVMVSLGVFAAVWASKSLVGAGLYWHTVQWFRDGEGRANRKFSEMVTVVKSNHGSPAAAAATVDSDVLPFWREACQRSSSIDLDANSSNLSDLNSMQTVACGRVNGYQMLAEALRENSPEAVRRAEEEIRKVDANMPKQAH